MLCPLLRLIQPHLLPSLPPSSPHTPGSHLTTTTLPLSRSRLRGVVSDMDGTLTIPLIDFQAMYKAVLGEEKYTELKSRSKAGIDILGIIEEWSELEKGRAYEVIADFEREGLERLQIMPVMLQELWNFDAKKIRRGLITRNVKAAVDIFHQRFGMNFSPALSREFRPYKPDPGPLLHICSTWEVQPHEVLMIGDGLKDDVACGNRAGAFACLV
ncbi:Haloacid dehalogenase-like hydrolase domain-containing protein [Drosera capensis]